MGRFRSWLILARLVSRSRGVLCQHRESSPRQSAALNTKVLATLCQSVAKLHPQPIRLHMESSTRHNQNAESTWEIVNRHSTFQVRDDRIPERVRSRNSCLPQPRLRPVRHQRSPGIDPSMSSQSARCVSLLHQLLQTCMNLAVLGNFNYKLFVLANRWVRQKAYLICRPQLGHFLMRRSLLKSSASGRVSRAPWCLVYLIHRHVPDKWILINNVIEKTNWGGSGGNCRSGDFTY